jgi:hypothetical protein
VTLSIRTRLPLRDLMALDDEELATYFDVLNESDKEAKKR